MTDKEPDKEHHHSASKQFKSKLNIKDNEELKNKIRSIMIDLIAPLQDVVDEETASPQPKQEDIEKIKQQQHEEFSKILDKAKSWKDSIVVDDITCRDSNEYLVLQNYRESIQQKANEFISKQIDEKKKAKFLSKR